MKPLLPHVANLCQAAGLLLLGSAVLLMGLIALPVTLALLLLREKFGVKHPTLISVHEFLGVLGWLGLSNLLHGLALLKRTPD